MREEQLVSEKLAKDFFRKIAMADDPYDVINKLMLQKGPEGDAIRDIYNDVSVDHGLHPDDDFEEILDFMVQDFEDMQPAESKSQGDAWYKEQRAKEAYEKANPGKRWADLPYGYKEDWRKKTESVEGVQEQEDEEYDPRRVKADVMKHLVNIYNDAKKTMVTQVSQCIFN